MKSRFLDPAMFYIDWENDDFAPSLSECLGRAGMDDVVTHTAVEDSIQVSELISYAVRNKLN